MTAPVVDTDAAGPLDHCPVTKRMRHAARLAGVTGDDATVQRWHARTTRRLAAAVAKLHGFTPAE